MAASLSVLINFKALDLGRNDLHACWSEGITVVLDDRPAPKHVHSSNWNFYTHFEMLLLDGGHLGLPGGTLPGETESAHACPPHGSPSSAAVPVGQKLDFSVGPDKE